MRTVENNRTTDSFETATGTCPRFQGLAVEKLLSRAGAAVPNVARLAAWLY